MTGRGRRILGRWRSRSTRENKFLFDRAGALWDSGHLKEAFELYRRLAEDGDEGAMLNVGHFYDRGRGVPLSREKAIYWWRKLAGRRNGLAATNLGKVYEDSGHSKLALRWYRKAVEWGDDDALDFIGSLYLGPLATNGREAQVAFEQALEPDRWVTQETLDFSQLQLNFIFSSRSSLRNLDLPALDRACYLA